MLKDSSKKYRPFPPIELTNRQWPSRTLSRAPIWCSVDLRDGNQALAVPMNVSQKLELFQALVKCGFKQIEVGFPSASNTEFTFNRRLIEEQRAPADVWLQVLVQAREDLIERTFQSLVGAKRTIIHLSRFDLAGSAPRGIWDEQSPNPWGRRAGCSIDS